MGKQGPCYHCGVTSTPLWRNGPPEKPVLCNACGSRWRTKGTLTNYTPLHSRADVIGLEDYKGSKVKTISIKTKELKLHKRKYSDAIEDEGEPSHSDQNFWKVVEDTSNRSSSGSAISYSESCAHFGGTEVNDWTGSAQSAVWDSLVPSRRRTCVSRPKPSSVEKLTKDLFCILREQQQSSFLSGSSEEDLLFESGTPMDSFEIGHGSVLIKHLREARDEESEASSLPLDKRTQTVVTESYSGSTSLHASNGSELTEIRIVGDEKVKKVAGQGAQECPGREKISHDNHHLLRNINSPLKFIDLKDVVNFGEFTKHLTDEEQLQLMKYLPSTDTAKLPGSLKSMFDTSQFLETLSSFQQLLLEGIFDLSFPGINAEECRSLKRLALVNLTKSKWVEHYQQLKNKSVGGGKTDEGIPKFLDCGSPVERPRDDKNMHFPDLSSNSFLHSPKFLMKIPKRVQKGGNMNPPKPSQTNFTGGSSKASYESKDTDNEGSCFSPRSLFTFPPDRSSCMLDSFQFSDESSEHDLLYNVPSNACFPQAELLDRNIWKAKPKISEIQVDNHEEALYSHPSTSFSSQKPNNSGLVYSHPVLR